MSGPWKEDPGGLCPVGVFQAVGLAVAWRRVVTASGESVRQVASSLSFETALWALVASRGSGAMSGPFRRVRESSGLLRHPLFQGLCHPGPGPWPWPVSGGTGGFRVFSHLTTSILKLLSFKEPGRQGGNEYKITAEDIARSKARPRSGVSPMIPGTYSLPLKSERFRTDPSRRFCRPPRCLALRSVQDPFPTPFLTTQYIKKAGGPVIVI